MRLRGRPSAYKGHVMSCLDTHLITWILTSKGVSKVFQRCLKHAILGIPVWGPQPPPINQPKPPERNAPNKGKEWDNVEELTPSAICGKMKCKLCGHELSGGALQGAVPENQWPWCGALHSEESKLKPAATGLKKVEQQSQAKQEQGAQKRQLDMASKRKAKKRSAGMMRRQNRGVGGWEGNQALSARLVPSPRRSVHIPSLDI